MIKHNKTKHNKLKKREQNKLKQQNTTQQKYKIKIKKIFSSHLAENLTVMAPF